jgi:hypothetical protein
MNMCGHNPRNEVACEAWDELRFRCDCIHEQFLNDLALFRTFWVIPAICTPSPLTTCDLDNISHTMGNEQSTVCDEHVVDKLQPLILMGRLSRHTFRCSNRGQKIYLQPDQAEPRTSSPSSPWLRSFLDLPASVRRCIYTHMLIVHEEVRIMPSQITKVPALALLQTCQQLHDEASAFFYASNAFRCYVKKIIPAQKASSEQPQYPRIRARLDSRTLCDPLNISGGFLFPAPRYHQHLTHLVIQLEVVIAHFDVASPGSTMPTFAKPEHKT